MDPAATDHLKRQEELEAARGAAGAAAQEIRDMVMPLADSPNATESVGQRTHGKVWDNSAEFAAEIFVSGIYSILTPPGLIFVRPSSGDDRLDRQYDVARWIEHATKQLFYLFNYSDGGFATAQPETIWDYGAYGNGTKFIWHDRFGRIRFDARPWGEMYICEGPENRIDTWYRKFSMTIDQAWRKWGERAGPTVARLKETEKARKLEFVQAIYPREKPDPSRGRLGMPYGECVVSREDKTKVQENGYEEAPMVTGRWVRNSSQAGYGRGPGHRALNDINSLQYSMRTTLRAGGKAVDPPLMLPDDGVVGRLNMNPNALNYYRSGAYSIDPIKAIHTGADPRLGEELNQGIRARIDMAFYRAQFQTLFLRDPRMTATEVLERKAEMRRLLLPMSGRMLVEDLEPTAARVFAEAYRLGYILPMPDALARVPNLQMKFVNELVNDQKLVEAQAVARTHELMAARAQAFPELLDNFDLDEEYRLTASVFGYPLTALRDPKQVAAIRAARAEEVARQAQAQEAGQVVQLAAGGARAARDLAQAAQPMRSAA